MEKKVKTKIRTGVRVGQIIRVAATTLGLGAALGTFLTYLIFR